MPEQDRVERGLLDTSVIIDLESIPSEDLPREVAISAITLAELAAGPAAARDATVRATRQDRLQRTEAVFDPLPFDADASRAYGRVFAAIVDIGRKPRGARSVDLLIAATALAHSMPLYTRNPDDFIGLEQLIDIHEI